MDMLSVLLHEYGHALGFEHSTNNGDFMAASLQPGERRLPSADELSLMSRLIAQISGSTGSTNNNDPQDPTLPNNPLPLLGLLPMAFLRRSSGAGAYAPSQNLQAINTTFTNGDFSTGTSNWQTNGNTTLGGNGSVILGESNNADSHLAQGFMINNGDRFLSFNVVDDQLQANDGTGPNDAFEVALLNATTGAAVGATDGFSHSDALLNIQTDGTEHAASKSTRSPMPMAQRRITSTCNKASAQVPAMSSPAPRPCCHST
jgi:hypothetical protein